LRGLCPRAFCDINARLKNASAVSLPKNRTIEN
jgi:hypothetical protein